MDALHWVNRDSYLPQGSRGLKVGAQEGRRARHGTAPRDAAPLDLCRELIPHPPPHRL